MTVTTLRPNVTSGNDGPVTVTGAGGDLDTATSDNSDATYIVTAANQGFEVGVGTFTLPAGAVVKQYAARGRANRTSAGSSTIRAYLGVGQENALVTVSSTGIVTWTWLTLVESLIQAEIDALRVEVTAEGATSPELVRVYELYIDVTYVAVPVVAPSAPTGTITTDLPTVEWPAPTLDSDGGVQTKYQVKVFTDAEYGAGGFDPDTSTPTLDSGELSGADLSWEVSTELAEDTWRAYVRVAQTVNGADHWGDWAYTGFVVDTPDPPAAPTLSATGEPDDGRIALAVASGGGAVSASAFEFERSLDGGTTWEHIRTTDGDGLVLSGASTTIYDFEAPNGELVDYRARALHDYSGVYLAGAWTEDGAEWTSNDQWLKHPLDPNLNMVVVIHAYESRQRAARRGVFQPLGRTDTIVISDTRGSATGEVVFRVDTEEEQDALDVLLDTLSPLLLQVGATDIRPDRWVSFGDHARQALVDKAWVESTLDSLTWTEVERP